MISLGGIFHVLHMAENDINVCFKSRKGGTDQLHLKGANYLPCVHQEFTSCCFILFT